MDDKGIPSRFEIYNEGEAASTPFDNTCTKITFRSTEPTPATWCAIPVEGGFFAFQQPETGKYATAVEGQVLACPDFSNESQSSWNVVRNADGTYLVALNTTKVIWTVKSDGYLGLGPAIENPQNTFNFIPA